MTILQDLIALKGTLFHYCIIFRDRNDSQKLKIILILQKSQRSETKESLKIEEILETETILDASEIPQIFED
jgi:hypothetical protein